MDVEKIKLIVNNMECLVRCLKEEISKEEPTKMEYVKFTTPYDNNDYDEVYLDEN
jgi:hypothetical protein